MHVERREGLSVSRTERNNNALHLDNHDDLYPWLLPYLLQNAA